MTRIVETQESDDMNGKRFHIEVEGIVFDAYIYEPEVEILNGVCQTGHSGKSRSIVPNKSACMAEAVCPESFVTVDIYKLRKAGIPEYVISMIIENKEELSILKITRSARIILSEYKLEIKMPPSGQGYVLSVPETPGRHTVQGTLRLQAAEISDK